MLGGAIDSSRKSLTVPTNLKFGLRIMMRKGGCALSPNTMGKRNTKTDITYKQIIRVNDYICMMDLSDPAHCEEGGTSYQSYVVI